MSAPAILQCRADTMLQRVINNSEAFRINFPVQAVRCKHLLNEPDISAGDLERCATSAYPLLHEEVVPLFVLFLVYKNCHGSAEERKLYAGMGVVELVDRLLRKRAATFTGPNDTYLLVDGRRGYGGWDDVGKARSKSPLGLEDCLSYDEMKLSALLSVSSYSHFINDGGRNNAGRPVRDPTTIQRSGVVINLTGPRFQRPEKMDWEEVLVTGEQNTKSNGYGPEWVAKKPEFYWRKMWAQFYNLGDYLPLYSQAANSYKCSTQRYEKLCIYYFDDVAYSNRLAVSFETLLLEAQSRAQACNKCAYVHVVGIGMGQWMISEHQEEIFLGSFAYTLRRLIRHLPNVSDINFAWFKENTCGGVANGGYFTYGACEPRRGIKIHFSKRNPHDKLEAPHHQKLLVVSYPSDSNSLPGNEFWIGSLTGSGNSAQACSSQIVELQNPHINDTRVRGANLQIATKQHGMLHVGQYSRWKYNASKI